MASRGSVVVTGASTGIGSACVKVLEQAGFHVFGRVRLAPNPFQEFLTTRLPKRLVDRTIARQIGLLPPAR